ncbi:MAG: bifunctional glutamate N-acetyltransferase/amino-acid acetyltransferase ArgJ [Thermodesulfobacteria bacterium]|nr:bifunctional glutamate N-acetyltransferase/amino-acid acetyltransferase ArgJ [Thermodesulfobacteriota bacterium]
MEIPRGFLFNALAAGIKKEGLDLGLIWSEKEAVAAATFTQNVVKAAPVILGHTFLEHGKRARAILVNSGCANACTGEDGLKDAEEILGALASITGTPVETILPASTGVIGERLPVNSIKERLGELFSGLSPEKYEPFARAMMTTDTFPKIVSRRLALPSGLEGTILGFAKGAGMIAPNMATMLAFVLTDLGGEKTFLQKTLQKAVEFSFNRITVDGDTSTNDTVYLLANGLQGEMSGHQDQETFEEALQELCQELARLIVKDGEGATKLVRVRLEGARTEAEALTLAKTVANSLLVKTAFFGEDPNWGRILAAMGRAGINFDPYQVDIYINQIQIVKNGLGKGKEAEGLAHQEMKKPEFILTIKLKEGNSSAEVLTCDLSYEYVKINAEYRT